MQLDIHQALVPLSGSMPLQLQAAAGTRLRAVDGSLWITFDGDLADNVLAQGQSLVLADDRPLLISALQGSATVGLCEPRAQASSPRRGRSAPRRLQVMAAAWAAKVRASASAAVSICASAAGDSSPRSAAQVSKAA